MILLALLLKPYVWVWDRIWRRIMGETVVYPDDRGTSA